MEKKVMDDYVKVVKEEYEKALAEMEEERDEAIEKKEEVEEEETTFVDEVSAGPRAGFLRFSFLL